MTGLIAVGILCVALGFVIGFRPLSTATLSGVADLSCGSALAPVNHDQGFSTFVVPGPRLIPRHFAIRPCSDVRHAPLVLTIVLWVAGALLLVGAMGLSFRRHSRPLESN